MKVKLLVLLSVMLYINVAVAQAPPYINYQAVVRNAQGQPLATTVVQFQLFILDGITGGTTLFTETDTATTNQFGLVTLQIGKNSQLDTVNWGNGAKFLQVKISYSGNPTLTDMGTTQLISVPYALYAQSAGNGFAKHYIGEYYGGGIVFWVDSLGQHGLISALSDQGCGLNWSNSITLTNAMMDSIGAGKLNTTMIVIGLASGSAEWACATYRGGGYGDCYMPGTVELTLLFANMGYNNPYGIGGVNGLISGTHWSSTETDVNRAMTYDNNSYYAAGKQSGAYCVRAIRSF